MGSPGSDGASPYPTLRLPDTDTGTDTSSLTLTSIGRSNVHMNVHPPK